VTDETGTLIEYYRYDANGNRTESHLHGTGYVTGTGNRLLSDGTYDYPYDAEGNMISKTDKTTGEVNEFYWDYRSRLTRVVVKDSGGTITAEDRYRYGVFNRRTMIWEDDDGAGPNDPRVTWVVNDNLQPPSAADLLAARTKPAIASEISNWLRSSFSTGNSLPAGIPASLVDAVLLSDFFAADPLIDFVDPDGPGPQPATLHVRRLYGPAVDMLLSRTFSDGTTDWCLTDLLGSVRAAVDETGSSLADIAYDSYGNISDAGGAETAGRFLWLARERDRLTGLTFVRARFLDTENGRFLAADPVGFSAKRPNLFLYAAKNPTASVDRAGLEDFIVNDFGDDWDRVNLLHTILSYPYPVEAIIASSIEEAVDQILKHLEPGEKIDSIQFWGHGYPGGIKVG